MATDTIMLRLPDDLYRRIVRLSQLMGSPVEGVIVRMLSSSLPPLPDDFSPEIRDALQSLESLNDKQLAALSTAMLSRKDIARLRDLRERRAEGPLTAAEQTELDRLVRAADMLTLQKAYAAVLLKWRGQTPNTPVDSAQSNE